MSLNPRPEGLTSIELRHNIEVAHRLTKTPGKCTNIHGHSMWVELQMWGPVGNNGIVLEFGEVKRLFRHHLDTELDHRLLLSKDDPWARTLKFGEYKEGEPHEYSELPGLAICIDGPTTENIARWIGEWSVSMFGERVNYFMVTVHETAVNAAQWRFQP